MNRGIDRLRFWNNKQKIKLNDVSDFNCWTDSDCSNGLKNDYLSYGCTHPVYYYLLMCRARNNFIVWGTLHNVIRIAIVIYVIMLPT